MFIFSIFFLLYNLFDNCNGFIKFHQINIKTHKINSITMLNDFNLDNYNIDIIQKNKNYFSKENVADLISEINNNKLSKIFISKDYNEIIGIKITNSDSIFNKFYLIHSNSIELPTILNKAYEHHIPTNFIDLNPSLFSFSRIQKSLEIILNISGYLIPIIFLTFLY